MAVTVQVLFDHLENRFSLTKAGQGLKADLDLTPPLFYLDNMVLHEGQVVVLRTEDLPPSSHVECLYLCVGKKPPRSSARWMGSVVHVGGADADLVSVFNEVQQVFSTISAWEHRISDLAADGSFADMVRESLPIFENRITIVDYDLRMLASCIYAEDRHLVVVDGGDSGGESVPSDIMAHFSSYRTGSLSSHEPYLIEGDSEGRCYCVNVFNNETYAGSCSLVESEERPFRESDFVLLPLFARYVQRKISLDGNLLEHTSASFRTVFERILSSFPVSSQMVQRAIELKELSLGRHGLDAFRWFCVVAQSANGSNVLSERFLCDTFEQSLPMSVALAVDNCIAVFCQLDNDESVQDIIDGAFRPILSDLNLEAGVSRTFSDIFHARDYYAQARCALEAGIVSQEEENCHCFDAIVLDYMLAGSCGDFNSRMIVSPGLVLLARKSREGVDYLDTLRVYLDNECSTAKSARELFIHRSTLVDRINRISEYVSLETPAERLYLRMCLALEDASWVDNPDV